MKKSFVVLICVLFLAGGRAWAQETNVALNDAVDQTANAAMPQDNADDMENEADVNDEGYATDDEEYYGSENDIANTQDNADEALPANADEPMPADLDGPVADNAVGK